MTDIHTLHPGVYDPAHDPVGPDAEQAFVDAKIAVITYGDARARKAFAMAVAEERAQQRAGAFSIGDLQRRAYKHAESHGFWDGENDNIPSKIALIHSEASEALEEFRDHLMDTVIREDGKPEGFASELADIVIRVMDLAEAKGVNLEREILLKMDFNESRTRMHGGKRV